MAKHYLRFEHAGVTQYGIVHGGRVFALQGDVYGEHNQSTISYSLEEIRVLTPCAPSKIVCVGLNYLSHAEELGLKIPDEPLLFLKPPSSLVADQADVVYWPGITRLDYEGEIAVVMGKTCHRVTEAAASEYIFGYTIANDITARDLQHKDGQWTRGKGFDTFLPLGRTITRQINPSDLRVQTYVNGVVKQDGRTSDLIFAIPSLISFISHVMTLYPGDVIITGTPSGIGPLQVGDVVEVRIEGLGTLTNKVRAPLD